MNPRNIGTFAIGVASGVLLLFLIQHFFFFGGGSGAQAETCREPPTTPAGVAPRCCWDTYLNGTIAKKVLRVNNNNPDIPINLQGQPRVESPTDPNPPNAPCNSVTYG